MTQHKKISLFMIFLLAVGCSHVGNQAKRGRVHQAGHSRVAKYDIPMEINDRVLGQISFFKRDKDRFSRYLSRSTRYEKWMKVLLKEEGVPQDLFYLALIESGFSNHAYSRARALGPWQFIRSTGKVFGLDSNWWLDERKDPEKSTRAAARYLKRLHREFGDWYLALAAYNAGEGKIRRAIREAGLSNFWDISRPGTRYLKQETKDYVPRFIAATLMAKSPQRYGLQQVAYGEPFQFDVVHVKGPMDIGVAAGLVSAKAEDVHFLNPELNQFMTPPHSYELRLPVGTATQFKTAYASLPPEEKIIKVVMHKVLKGETLAKIAKRYGVSSQSLMVSNHLSPRKKLRPGTVINVPRRLKGGSIMAAADDGGDESFSRQVHYRVRRGDTLSAIARRHGMSVASVQELNGLKGSHLRVGQRIKIAQRNSSSPTMVEGEVLLAYNKPARRRTNGVEWLIRQEQMQEGTKEAADVNEGVVAPAEEREVLDAENISYSGPPEVEEVDLGTLPQDIAKSAVMIPPKGERLAESGGVAEPRKHLVTRGENLWRISRKYDVPLNQLREWNRLENDRIKPGRALIVGE